MLLRRINVSTGLLRSRYSLIQLSSSIAQRAFTNRDALPTAASQSSAGQMSTDAIPLPRRQRIAYLTDVEGSMTYFQEWVRQSQVVQWELKCTPESTAPSSSLAASIPSQSLTYVDLNRFVLGFKDSDTQFVFGGDAFDHGSDLAFSRAVLDFKKRFPNRVHLILGNRDLNKLVMRYIFGPTWSKESSNSVQSEISSLNDIIGTKRIFSRGVAGHLNPDNAEEALFPCVGGPPTKMTYFAFLKLEADQKAGTAVAEDDLQAEPVSFLKWSLIHRMGSPNAFEHRRAELHEIRKQLHELAGSADEGSEVTDEEVAASFATAGEPGGAYYEYLLRGQLVHVIGSALFVHGGICEENLGVVPAVHADYRTPLSDCQRLVDVVVPEQTSPDAGAQPPPGQTIEEEPVVPCAFPLHDNAGDENTSIPWFNALHRFKREALEEYTMWVRNRGNALRRYGNHRFVTKYSVTVNSLVSPKGPSYFSLPVVQFLLMNGISTVCVGHMPTGDTPAIIRQPPSGCVTCIAADNSYCGRENAFSSPSNPRGKAMSEVVLHLNVEMPQIRTRTADMGSENGEEEEEEFIDLHGTRADGTPFSFEIRPEEPYLGRCIQRQIPASAEKRASTQSWWVKRRGIFLHPDKGPSSSVMKGEEFYALHHTSNRYFSEQEEVHSVSELEKMFNVVQAQLHPCVGGVLRDTETKESLRNVPVHRIKTKVQPSHNTLSAMERA